MDSAIPNLENQSWEWIAIGLRGDQGGIGVWQREVRTILRSPCGVRLFPSAGDTGV